MGSMRIRNWMDPNGEERRNERRRIVEESQCLHRTVARKKEIMLFTKKNLSKDLYAIEYVNKLCLQSEAVTYAEDKQSTPNYVFLQVYFRQKS